MHEPPADVDDQIAVLLVEGLLHGDSQNVKRKTQNVKVEDRKPGLSILAQGEKDCLRQKSSER